ncbi:LysR substrate-binding domain-containing protein [Shewanella sp. GXUN23E]|uniref:LysR substrate-binding domain-containing protein n=1 Tax=Shewanella sp. GXUN23E TaxID=3422498 RepID=UPI003D7EC8EE
MHKLTHLNGIRAFEAAARHRSFALAAKELNVTPAAVGQQVRQLEDWLGQKLFMRSQSGNNRLTPTPQAELALQAFQTGLNHLASGLELLKSQAQGQLTISLSPSIASKWLMPRLAEFQQQFPDISLSIQTGIELQNYLTTGIDIGIRYGKGHWAGMQSELLMQERVFPVCAPTIQQAGLSRPEQLSDLPILFDMSVASDPDYPDWAGWFRSQGLPPAPLKGMKINSSAELIDAAIRAQGVALGREILVSEELQSGRLVCPFGTNRFWMTSSMAYYIVWPADKICSRAMADFRSWLHAQASITPRYCLQAERAE